jgi:hypothetical protein
MTTKTISMMMSNECDNNQDQNSIVSAFPDDSKMTDERELGCHTAAVTLYVGKSVEGCSFILHVAWLCIIQWVDNKGYTLGTSLYIQKGPGVSLKLKCAFDPQAFVLCDHSGKSALHMVARARRKLRGASIYLAGVDHSWRIEKKLK